MSNSKQPKSTDHSTNIDKMREIVRNTENNVHEAEFGRDFLDPVQSELVKEKNKRRKQSIEELKAEIKEDVAARKKGKD